MAFNWTCQFCGRPTTITDPHFHRQNNEYELTGNKYGKEIIRLATWAISCPNPECKEITFHVDLHTAEYRGVNLGYKTLKNLKSCFLLPESFAKPQPDYIPEGIRKDYYEACQIRNLSPKASASLARRCLQGMIRDFWGIKKARLKDEIDALKEKIAPQIWHGIDAVREVGNIGAHMEKDVNLIIEVEPDEAQKLIGLIEFLFENWYVSREETRKKLEALKTLAEDKKEAKKSNNKKNPE